MKNEAIHHHLECDLHCEHRREEVVEVFQHLCLQLRFYYSHLKQHTTFLAEFAWRGSSIANILLLTKMHTSTLFVK